MSCQQDSSGVRVVPSGGVEAIPGNTNGSSLDERLATRLELNLLFNVTRSRKEALLLMELALLGRLLRCGILRELISHTRPIRPSKSTATA